MFQGFWRRHTKLANLRFNAVKDLLHDAADLIKKDEPPAEAKKDDAPVAKKDEPKKEETTEGTKPPVASPKSDP